ncbi:MAG: PilN domain-containing protein [Candidatus Pacebacteria bacterium]|nr:PilN domain-containing protein [Candidatus Paceibacterota bacterium]
MINLLPSLEKENLYWKRQKKKIIILWLLFLFFTFCLFLILVSIIIYLNGQADFQKIVLENEKTKFENSEVQSLQEKLKSANTDLTNLNKFYSNRTYFSDLMEKISQTLPSGVYLKNISIVADREGSKNIIKISLSGFAETRELLFNFKSNLEQESYFKEFPDFPSSNWLKPEDIDFSFTFTLEAKN